MNELHAHAVPRYPDKSTIPEGPIPLEHKFESGSDQRGLADFDRAAVRGDIDNSASDARAIARQIGNFVDRGTLDFATLFHASNIHSRLGGLRCCRWVWRVERGTPD